MFQAGQEYNRKELHDRFGGQRQGGISTPSGYPLIMLFTGESGGRYGYRDEFQPDGTFWYTGEGTVGDMTLGRGNGAIQSHARDGKAMHLFEQLRKGWVRYIGEGTYLRHHMEERSDVEGNLRQAIIFELQVDVPGGKTRVNSRSPRKAASESAMWKLPLDELKLRAVEAAPKGATQQERRVNVYERSQAVRIYVLRRAGGKCEGCGAPAPFRTKKGRAYLEPHHIRRRSDGGPDDPKWVAALCPNCHREVHHGEDGDRKNSKLIASIAKAESQA